MEPDDITPFVGLRRAASEKIPINGNRFLRVYYIDAYYPKRFTQAKTHLSTLRLLELKNGDSDAVRHFAQLVAPLFVKSNLPPSFVAVPGHGRGPAPPNSGLRQVIDRIDGASDLSDCLARTLEVPKSAGAAPGTRRTAAEQIPTLGVRHPERIVGKDVVLFDDVITRGETMRAARYLILSKGRPASLTCLALTRTRSGAEPAEPSSPAREEDIEF